MIFEVSSHFSVFLNCVFFGIVCGALYGVFRLIGRLFRSDVAKFAVDASFSIPCVFAYDMFSVELSFPDFRWYMLGGVAFGFFLYRTSFGKTLAKTSSLLYNRLKSNEKTNFFIRRIKGVGRKIKKNRRRGRRDRRRNVVFTNGNNDLPNRVYVGKKTRGGKLARSNRPIDETDRGRQRRYRALDDKMEDRGTRQTKRVRLQGDEK